MDDSIVDRTAHPAPGVVIRVDKTGKLAIVVGRPTDHRQDFARLGVQGDHHARLRNGARAARVLGQVDMVDLAGKRFCAPFCQFQIKSELTFFPATGSTRLITRTGNPASSTT